MVDARGYSCPTPVVMVQKAVKNGSPRELEVAVDNQCSVENVTRCALYEGEDPMLRCMDEDVEAVYHRSGEEFVLIHKGAE